MCETEIRHMVCCSQMSKGACVWTKRKSPQTLPLIPMKSLTVWRGHSTRPSFPVRTARRASGSLPRGRRNSLIMQTTKNRKFPLGRFCPAGRKVRGTGCSNPPLLLLHKIHAKQKEQHPIRCCSWCDREDSNLWPSGSENCDGQKNSMI